MIKLTERDVVCNRWLKIDIKLNSYYLKTCEVDSLYEVSVLFTL